MTLEKLNQHKTEIELDLYKMGKAYNDANTNHILHLLLSLATMGLWLIVWLFTAESNARRRAKLEKLIDESKKAIIEIDSKLIPEARNRESGRNKKDTKECPWCAEIILSKAKICKHCGREV